MADKWFSVNEIAEYLGASEDSAYSRVISRGMPGYKVGRFGKFKRRRIDAWVRDAGAASSCDERGAKERSKGHRNGEPQKRRRLPLKGLGF